MRFREAVAFAYAMDWPLKGWIPVGGRIVS